MVPFSTNRNVFFCLQTLPGCVHFRDKSPFLLFLPAPDTSKRDSNVCEKVGRTLFTVSPVLDVPAHLSTQEVGRGRGLIASYIWMSSDPNRLGLDLNHRQNPGPACAAAGINVLGMSSAVIGSGVQVAMVDNASGIHKAFLKLFINGIIVVQTNAMLHTLKPRSSHVENVRSV